MDDQFYSCIFWNVCMQQYLYSIIKYSLLSNSELYRKMQNTCALQIKTARWTRGGGTGASSAVSRNVSSWEWSKKVRLCQTPLNPSARSALQRFTMWNHCSKWHTLWNQSQAEPTAEKEKLKLIQQLFFKVWAAATAMWEQQTCADGGSLCSYSCSHRQP